MALTSKCSRTSERGVVVAGPMYLAMPELAITTSMWVMLWVVLRKSTAVEASVGEVLSILVRMRVLPSAVGRVERAVEGAEVGSRTPTMTVVLGRRMREERRPLPIPERVC
jgi:hypothetical protein